MKKSIFLVALIVFISNIPGFSQNTATSLSVGAAKVNITPKPDALPSGFDSILDSLYAKAIVVSNGNATTAIVGIDNGMLSEAMWSNITQQIYRELGIPVENVLLSPTHTHNAPFLTFIADNSAVIANYIKIVEKGIFDVVKQAKSRLQPARIGYGTGVSYVNVNRDVIDPETRLWSQGPNSDGPSDKTVHVIKFESMTGELIAVYINYAMHANLMYMSGKISACMPGGVTGYVEDYYKNINNNNIVAIWTMGAAGDQNPIYFNSILGASRSGTEYAKKRQIQMISSIGQIVGEEVISVLEETKNLKDKITIHGSQKIVTCPGRTRTDVNNREGKPGTYVDGDPVNIKLSLLVLGDIAIAGVNAEIYNIIGQHLKEKSPLTKTIFVSITNGASNSGYIPSDDAFQRYTFQVLGSRLQPNCAETSIVNGLVEMIDEAIK
jgi:neutral ceramidase